MNNMKTLTLTILSALAIFGFLAACSCAVANAAPAHHTYTCTTVYVLGGTVTTCR